MEFDYVNELMLQGCWLETNRSEYPQLDPFFAWPPLESTDRPSNDSGHHEHRQRSSPKNPCISQSHSSVVEQLIQALSHITDRLRDKEMLIQVWIPISRGGMRVLSTHNQPFSLDPECPSKLAHYRHISANYQFLPDHDAKESMGLPGRVFMNRVPEWTPDVRFFSLDEYSRVFHAQQFDVRGTLGVPVLEQGGKRCLGVIEVVLTRQETRYRPQLESICEALEAANLKCVDASSTRKVEVSDLPYQHMLPEILHVLRSVCETHCLPLAQTWTPCTSGGRARCWRCLQGGLENCLSPVEPACHVADPHIRGFHEACTEHHLLSGQGVVGKAFGTNQPWFSPDVSDCSKTDYPLSHYARMFGLQSAMAICMRSASTRSADFILEFFLPTGCRAHENQNKMLNSLPNTIQKDCQSLWGVALREGMNFTGSGRSVEGFVGRFGCSRFDSKEGFEVVKNKSSTMGNGSMLHANRAGAKKWTKAEKAITLEVLRQHFSGSLKDAAKNVGVCPTTLKRICREHGIQRWPSRKIKKLGHSVQKIRHMIDSVHGSTGILQFESMYSVLVSQTASNFPDPKTLARPLASSSSGLVVKDDPGQVAVNTSFCKIGGRRVKVHHGEDTIRLRMQSCWGYNDLLREIIMRFGMGDVPFVLKYLDDDAEWILMMCDADLEECIDVCRSSDTIRLSLVRQEIAPE